MQVASRATRHDTTPSYLLKLNTACGDEQKVAWHSPRVCRSLVFPHRAPPLILFTHSRLQEYFIEADLAELRALCNQMGEV